MDDNNNSPETLTNLAFVNWRKRLFPEHHDVFLCEGTWYESTKSEDPLFIRLATNNEKTIYNSYIIILMEFF